MMGKSMSGLSIILSVILVASAISQGFLAVIFIRAIWRFRRGLPRHPVSPRTAVVLCLRGRDPFLENCLESILRQDHPDYQLRVVVDNRQDPAWEVAQSALDRYGAERVSIETLEDRRATCSLKCSAVVQAIGRLDDSFQAAAQLDADVVPHPSWLSELTAPLAEERFGAATGNRWYMPETGSWGALVRYLWNAAAIVQMYWYEVPWGGTLAVKRKAIDDAGLLDRWSHAFCEDTMLRRQLGKHGLRVKFVPSLMMVNREDCALGSCLSWIRRQLLTARLYHPLWPLVLLHGLSTTLILAVAVAILAIAAIRGDWPTFLWSGAGLLVYETIMFSLLVPMEIAVRRIVRSRGGTTKWLSAKILLRLIPAIVLTQFVYTLALLGAQFARKVNWRGVHYRIGGPWDIRRMDDSPYESDLPQAAEGHSL
jgi:cellulose synthase/poly-beta-1,6-N-acetylglucosamine synthase-like glycosyltransferase